MFNYIQNQNHADPIINNYCGGYALDAILCNLRNRNAAPLLTYNQIQFQQNNIGLNSTALIQQYAINGTNICLPSSIVFCMRNNYLLSSIVYYTQNTGAVISQNVIDEEIFRLGVFAVYSGNHNLQQILQTEGSPTRYWIVLVNGGGHWIAIKKENNLFYGYDPAGGYDEQITINNNNINSFNINYNWSEICIAV